MSVSEPGGTIETRNEVIPIGSLGVTIQWEILQSRWARYPKGNGYTGNNSALGHVYITAVKRKTGKNCRDI